MVKYFVFLYLCFGQNADAWEMSQKWGAVTIWKLKSNPNLMGSIQDFEKKSSLFDFKDKLKLVQAFEDQKKTALALFQIKKWSPEDYVLEDQSILVRGSYVDSNDQRVFFVEKHIQGDRGRKTFLLTSKSKKDLASKSAGDFFQLPQDESQ